MRGRSRFAGRFGRLVATVCVLAACSTLLTFFPQGIQRARGQLGTLAGWSFMLDPGHGGNDSGAVGPTGLRECEVNLSVSLKLRSLLEEDGATVYMTRTDDRAVSITDRWRQANELGVDRFISVHHNAVGDSRTNYSLVLISNYAGTEAEDLAIKAQNELVWELGIPSANPPVWRVDYCGVLNNTDMPAILTEASFISNPAEEQRLRDPYYNQREAEAIHRAVVHHCGGPHLYFIEPKEGALLHESFPVKVSVPEPSAITRVNFYLDDGYIGSESASPFYHMIDTEELGDGVYDLRAEAEYGSGEVLTVSTSIAVSNAAKKWYLAEGTTRKGFDEWVTILNSNEEDSSVEVTYCFTGKKPLVKTYNLPFMSRMTINVRSEVGDEMDVSLQVNASTPVVVERPMYFNYGQKWQGGHVVMGVNQPAFEWYFAEGCTRSGFEEWLCIYNPGDTQATVEIEYQGENGQGNQSRTILVDAQSRFSQNVNQVIGPDRNVSVRLVSSVPVVAERPLYFDYGGAWQGGSAAMGTTSASPTWYFAEGCTRSGFEEWLCMQNPNDYAANVLVNYVNAEGGVVSRNMVLDARSRRTVFVNQDAGWGQDISIALSSDAPIVAERPMYYDYHGWCKGGDVGSGVTRASRIWYFAEGYTGDGFDEWLCLLNPEPQDVEVTVLYFLPDGEVTRESYVLPAISRRTFSVNQLTYAQGDVSVYIRAAEPVVAERPIYFRYMDKWAGGSDNTGYFPGVR